MGTPTQYCDYWSGWVRLPKFVWSYPKFSASAGRPFSVGRPAAESLGGETGVRVGRDGRGRRPREGNVGNQNGNVVNENVQENDRNVLVNGNRVGCSYKELLACNLKEYDGKGGDVVLTRWIEKMENVQDMSGCSIDQKVKYIAGFFVGKALTWWNPQTLMRCKNLETEVWNRAMVGACHAAYTDRFHELARMVAAMEPKTMQKAMQISCALTDEAVKKIGNVREPSKDKNGRDDNKRTRTGYVFATTVNPVGTENAGAWPKCTTCNFYHAPGGPCRTCFNSNHPGHLAKDYRGVPRNMNHVNSRNTPGRACYECGITDHVRPVCPRLNRAQGLEGNRPNQVAANNREVVKDKAKGSETRVKGSSKRAGEELESDKSKEQKLDEKVEAEVDNDQEEAEMKMYIR
nr:hypothetical protein [Tanacetum cinerariifolium]